VLRSDGPRLIAALARQYRDIERAREAVQDAALRALETWPTRGIPERPGAWLFTVARHRLVDELRQAPAEDLPVHLADTPVSDDRLPLLFACCHPAIQARTQVGLALWTLCGLSMEEVARAFLERPATTARRLYRASSKIRDAGIPFEIPGPRTRAERIAGVLASIYLLFNEGYASTRERTGVRVEVCEQALTLGESVGSLLPDDPEVLGLRALMTLHHARRAGRFDARGTPQTLEQQDRTRWHADEIEAGAALLERALRRRQPGPYQLQAAIAALHAQADKPEDTDWHQITALYGGLLKSTPSPVVELNAAVALAMSAGPEAGLRWMDELVQRDVLPRYPLLQASRAELLGRLGRSAEAQEAYKQALAWTESPSERAFLQARIRGRPTRRRRTRTGRPGRRLAARDWRRVAALFPEQKGRGRPRRPDRDVLEAILWVLTTGAPWRETPSEFGPWRTIYHRFRVWENQGRLESVLLRLAHHPGSREGRRTLFNRPA
jgi:RNA polymerase sigma-70 factor (ECF subfamily)